MSVDYRPFIFLISGPSGVGKSTLLTYVMQHVPSLSLSVSHTTRQPRAGEFEGKDYFYVSRETFLTAIQNEEFVEYAEVHGNMYGTSKIALRAVLSGGQDVVLDIDSEGLRNLKPQFGDELVSVFIRPPDFETLERRLRSRGSETEDQLETRLKNARKEIEASSAYDYQVVNDDLQKASELLCSIIQAERAKTSRNQFAMS